MRPSLEPAEGGHAAPGAAPHEAPGAAARGGSRPGTGKGTGTGTGTDTDTDTGSRWRWRWRWRTARRLLAGAFVLLVLALAVRQLRGVDWAAVGAALRAHPRAELPVLVLLAALSYALYAGYELFGRHLTGHGLPVARTLTIGAAAYALNLNLGALVGSLGARLRFYERAGLDLAQATQVVGTSIVTNWMGYAALAGGQLAAVPPPLPPGWGFGAAELRGLGGALLAVALAYVGACLRWPMRRWRWRGHDMVTPSARVALMQITLAAANWLTMAALVWLAMQRRIDFTGVASVFLFAAVAGAMLHVPAGLGVLESVFVTLLGHRLEPSAIVAGLVVYRFVYYLVPLVIAGGATLWLERRRPGG